MFDTNVRQRHVLPFAMFAAVSAFVAAGCGAAVDADYAGAPARGEAPAAGETNYDDPGESPFVSAEEQSTSTFSVDVDTGSYTLMRRDLEDGHLPNEAGVRPEEYINFFQYDYPEPEGEHPFSVTTETGPSRFGPERSKLMRIGLKGEEIANEALKPTNLVFLIDVSGSMNEPDRLPLVKESLRTLLDHLRPSDRVGVVVYAGSEGVALESTKVENRQKIEDAIENLSAGGSTNGEAGIARAYQMAENNRIEGGNNRVVLATDGNFNVGRTGDDLIQLIEDYRKKHISLTVTGYGEGVNDAATEGLARKGNGNYFFIDSEQEARRVFGSELASTLEVIASDVKIQVEFSSDYVREYRLIGYDNRTLDNDEFDDDSADAGEIGPGHTVTAYYEIKPVEDPSESEGRVAEVRLRYKSQYGEESELLTRDVAVSDVGSSLEETSRDFRFGAAVAEYAEILRMSDHSEGARFDEVLELAEGATKGRSKRAEFVELVGRASELWEQSGDGSGAR